MSKTFLDGVFRGLRWQRRLRPALSAFRSSTRPLPTIILLIQSDLLALATAVAMSVWGRLLLGGTLKPDFYWRLWPLLTIFILIYASLGLYPGVALSPVDELRSVSVATTLIYFFLGAVIFMFGEGELYSRGAFLAAWLLSIALVLINRGLVRGLFARSPWWGYPVLVMGAGKTGHMVVRTLQRNPRLGLKPVVILDDDPATWGHLEGVTVLGELALAPSLARRLQIPYAIVAMPGVRRDRLLELMERYGHTFPHLLVIPDLFGLSSLWVEARDLTGVLGLEVRQQLLLPGPRLTKWVLEITIAILISLAILPLIALIALIIRLDSPGPVFYGHQRIGRRGKAFTAWKFRTMAPQSDQLLAQYLKENPEARLLWEQERKLKDDPRITRCGRWLRRSSLDELPQIWNVLRREMSLVGPRPIVADEVIRYADKFDLYTRVLPGITGLWQVSGRNNITYGERVSLDAYYVRNWSVWLDLYILIKTVWVVMRGEGAY
jgi:Undecaprenyl-phosphate galactose phosphotransferase WbaP